jgi:hypothetical protein
MTSDKHFIWYMAGAKEVPMDKYSNNYTGRANEYYYRRGKSDITGDGEQHGYSHTGVGLVFRRWITTYGEGENGNYDY